MPYLRGSRLPLIGTGESAPAPPPTASELADWYDAADVNTSGSDVTQINDKSDNSNDAAAAVGEEPTLNTAGANPKIVFDGAMPILCRDSSGYAGMADTDRPFSCVVAAHLAEPGTPKDTIVFAHKGSHPLGGTNDGIANVTSHITGETERMWRVSFRYAASYDKQDIIVRGSAVGELTWIAIRTVATGHMEIWRNGVLVGRRHMPDPLCGADITRVDIGTTDVDAGAGDINHDFYEGFSRINATDAQLTAAWAYMRDKYSITLEPSHGDLWNALGGGQAKYDYTPDADTVDETSNVVDGLKSQLPVSGELRQSGAAGLKPTYDATGGPNSKPMISFDSSGGSGNEEHLIKNTNVTTVVAGEYTYIAVVLRIPSDPGNHFNVFAIRDGATTQAAIIWLTGTGLRAQFRDTTSQKTIVDSGEYTINTWALVECWADEATGTLRMFVDNSEIGTAQTIVSGMNADIDTLLFGDSFNGQPAEMDVAAVKVGEGVTAAQRATIVSDLSTEFNLGL